MFSNQVKIMLYVNNVEESSQFWQTFGFVEKEREEVDGTLVVEIAPSESAERRLLFYMIWPLFKTFTRSGGEYPFSNVC